MTARTSTSRRRVFGVTLATLGVAAALVTVLAVRQGLRGGPAPASASPAPSALAVGEILRSAGVLLQQGEYAKAGAVLAPAVEAVPTDQDLRLAYAEALLGQREFVKSHDQFLAAIAIGPDAAQIRFDAGGVAHAAGLLEDAEEHYWHAQSLDPTDARFPLYLAQIQRKLGKIEEAKKNLLIAARLDPSLDIAWGVLADIALGENNLSIARTHIARARTLAPENLQWRIIESRIERRDNHPEKAVALLTGLTPEQRAQQPMVLREMALCCGLMEQPLEAAELYTDAVSVLPSEAPTRGELLREAAVWYERAGMIDEAIVYASRAAREGDAEADRLLDRLETRVREEASVDTDG